ncbi:MAG: hypothetical protein NWF01_11445 [Candidatus Bathyarchaeota archaeon]|nr:hypothetical protein [Candidatus Bathyarchaeota archaeon]
MAVIASVYLWVALGGGYLGGDIFFGVFMPIGLLILVALIVTFGLPMNAGLSEKEKSFETTFSNGMKEINQKIDSLTKEVDTIKKAIEE